MNKLLIVAIGLQIGLALTSDGLIQALAELTAFVLTVSLYLNYKKANVDSVSPSKKLQSNNKAQIEHCDP
ncbi:hypothetical protein JCM19235_4171 [Vibrio maritimus]|uniref:Uncharacterized protein n=1 Tax=Vibrio maritimus TaxID=990268 RepID=A0A090RXI4_9VIBR|nr:hypothetical protein JCM19235_4171 [Vibrio maritimus]